MKILPIYLYGSKVLRQVAKPISPDDPSLEELIANLYTTMAKSDGVGLAAPQVGISLRIFVVDASPYADRDPNLADFRKVFINPEIIATDGELVPFEEGCLSVPGIHENVLRPERVTLRYQDEKFVEHEEEFDGLIARIVQHEYDHLEGKVFIDRIAPLRKRLIQSKLKKITKGITDAAYPCKVV